MKLLVGCIKSGDAGGKIHAAGAVAAVAQHMRDIAELGTVQGLASGLVDLALQSDEALFRWGRQRGQHDPTLACI